MSKDRDLLNFYADKNLELNKFLQDYKEAEHWGKNVIDVAMDIISTQANQIEELSVAAENAQKEIMFLQKRKSKE